MAVKKIIKPTKIANPIAAARVGQSTMQGRNNVQVTKREKLNTATGKYEPSPTETSGDKYSVTRDSTGAITSLKIGESVFQGLNEQQYQELLRAHKNRPLSETEQWQANIDKNKRYNEFLQSTPEYQALLESQQPGELMVAPQNETSKEIQGNIAQKNLSEELSKGFLGLGGATSAEEFIDPNTGEPFDVQWFEATKLNKLTKNLPNSKTKTFVLNMASENPDWQKYVDGYSNEKSFNKLLEDDISADTTISTALTTAENPEAAKQSKKFFEDAIAKKRRIYADLKQIADNDPREYAQGDVRLKMTELEQYFREQEAIDRAEMNAKQQQALINKLKGGMQFG